MPQLINAIQENVVSRCRTQQDRTRRIFFLFNDDGVGGIDPAEFAFAIRNKMNIFVPTQMCRDLFNLIDVDRSGIITFNELKSFLFEGEARGDTTTVQYSLSSSPNFGGRLPARRRMAWEKEEEEETGGGSGRGEASSRAWRRGGRRGSRGY